MGHGERNRERGRVHKAPRERAKYLRPSIVRQSKGKESRVHRNHTPNSKNNPHHCPFLCQI